MTRAFDGAWCLVSREYPPLAGGGIGTYAESFARLLADRGIPVIVITAHTNQRTDEHADGIRIIRLPLNADDRWAGPHPSVASPKTAHLWRTLGPHSVFSAQIAELAPELFDRFGVRVIEGCDTGAPLWHLLDDRAQHKWAANVRIITHVHSPSLWIERLNRRLEQSTIMHELQRMEREQTRRADAVLTPSADMRTWLADNWGARATVIRYPFHLPDHPGPGDGGVLYVGRLEYRKGIDTLLRAWPNVRTDQPLTLVGRDVTDYRTNTPIGAALLRGLDRTEFLGPLPPPRVAQLQQRATVVAVPSPDDNFPFTCTEAMAAGRVVVAANAGGAAEMIEHGRSGLLFEPCDAAGLADALNTALTMNDAQRSAMGDAARARIAELCDPSRVIDERLAHAASGMPPGTDADPQPEPPIALRRLAPAAPKQTPLWKHALNRLRRR